MDTWSVSAVSSLSCINQEELTKTTTITTTTLGAVTLLYLNHSTIGRRSARNNVLALLKILERVNGYPLHRPDVPLWEIAGDISLSLLTPALLSDYQTDCVKRYQSDSTRDDPSQREAKERALRTSRSAINQAKCLFSTRGEIDMREVYRIHGLTLPECIAEFMKYKPRGRGTKSDYRVPEDSVVNSAFESIELMRGDAPVFLAFWLASGLGLRKKEIHFSRWEHVIEIDGHPWYRGGIGKDGREICVPFQLRAFESIASFRKEDGFIISERSDRWAKRLSAWMRKQGWNTQKTLHELRSWLGSRLYAVSPVSAKNQMRHKSVTVTEDFYVRYSQKSRPPQVL